MSVYTEVSEAQLRAFLQPLSVGRLLDFQGIEGGVVNSNFFVNTDQGRFVLTLFEDLESEDLPFFVELNHHLGKKGLPCAMPVRALNGESVFELNGRPACLFSCLPGRHLMEPAVEDCRAMGAVMGQMHQHVRDFPKHREDDRGVDWFTEVIECVLPKMTSADTDLLKKEWQWQLKHPLAGLPSGIIHADLFRDNVLFENGAVSGLIDFYFACQGAFVYDLAIVINDWCTEHNGSLDEERLGALLSAYQSNRRLAKEEELALPGAMRLAALRFWLSRLQESFFPAEGALVLIKDPTVFKRILVDRQNQSEKSLTS